MKTQSKIVAFSVILALAASGCRSTRFVEEGDHLVVKNVVHLNENGLIKPEVDESDIALLIRQKPNRKLFGFIPFYLYIWNYANKHNTEKRFFSYLKNDVGEAPVLYEPALKKRTEEGISQYLKNKGYFDNNVSSYALLGKNTVEQHFYVYTGHAYTIRKVSFTLEDTALMGVLKQNIKTKLIPGERFDSETFDQERERLSNANKNQGYFTFEKSHVVFDVDTNIDGFKLDVSVRLLDRKITEEINGVDSVLKVPHKKHRLTQVVINPQFNARSGSIKHKDSLVMDSLTFLLEKKPAFRPSRLKHFVYLKPGALYNLDKSKYTYDRINALNNFKYINIKYNRTETNLKMDELEVMINLTPAPKQSIAVETIGTNSSGNLGISANVNYSNKNLFKGAEVFRWTITGGLEAQRTNSQIGDQSASGLSDVSPFNTFEYGTEVGLTIPDFILSKTNSRLPFLKEPRSIVSAAVNRQSRPQFLRDLLNVSYQISARTNSKDQLSFFPADVSIIRLDKTQAFEDQLQRTQNAFLINSYNNHFIPAGRISYSISTQKLNTLRNFSVLKTNFESAGNLLRMGMSISSRDPDPTTNSYNIYGIRFAQYVKGDIDFSRQLVVTEDSRFVYRFFTGAGRPLTNLNTLPFERSFFAGGSNDIRAWRARSLGPGSLADTAQYGIDQVGEFQLEANFEYRFNLVGLLDAAIFTDVGNIWFLRYDPDRKGAEFDPATFYKEVAIAPGVGARLNFNFFIIRFDLGMQLHNPALPVGERWVFQPKQLTDQYREAANVSRSANGQNLIPTYEFTQALTLNLAIGYPF